MSYLEKFRGVSGLWKLRKLAKLHGARGKVNRGSLDVWRNKLKQIDNWATTVQVTVVPVEYFGDSNASRDANREIATAVSGAPKSPEGKNWAVSYVPNFTPTEAPIGKDHVQETQTANLTVVGSFTPTTKQVIESLAKSSLQWTTRDGAQVALGKHFAGDRYGAGNMRVILTGFIPRGKPIFLEKFKSIANKPVGNHTMTYPNLTDKYKKCNMKETCGYQLLYSEFRIGSQMIVDVLGGRPEMMTPNMIKKVLQTYKRAFIGVDLMHGTVVHNSNEAHRDHHTKVPVMVFASNHVYTTTEAIRKRVVNRNHKGAQRQAVYEIEDDETPYEITTAMPIVSGLKTKRVYVNSRQTNFNKQWVDELSQGNALSVTMQATNVVGIKIGKTEVHIADNAAEMVRITKALGWNYKGQSIGAVATIVWNKHHLNKVEPTPYNEQLEQFLMDNAMREPIVGTFMALPGEQKAIDFYRAFTSVALNGGFYRLKSFETFTPMPAGAVVDRDHIYYVSPSKSNKLIDTAGIYDPNVVEYAMFWELITVDDIKGWAEIERLPKMDQILKKVIEYAYDKLEDGDAKRLVNAMIGILGKSSVRKNQAAPVITVSAEEAMYYRTKNPAQTEIQTVPLNQEYEFGAEHKQVYIVSRYKTKINPGSHTLTQMAITQRARLKTYSLAKRIERLGGSIQYINTDSVQYTMPDILTRRQPGENKEEQKKRVQSEKKQRTKLIKLHKGKKEPTFGDTRVETVNQILNTEMAGEGIEFMNLVNSIKTTRRQTFGHALAIKTTDDPSFVVEPWMTVTLNETVSPSMVWGKEMEFKRAYINGIAGTGKSKLLRDMAEKLNSDGYTVVIVAPTHVAAKNVGGVTIHSVAKKLQEHPTSFDGLKIAILVDELSMVQRTQWQFLNTMPEETLIYGFGDHRQLPPVKADMGMYNMLPQVRSLFNNRRVQLTKVWRNDKKFAADCIAQYEGERDYLENGSDPDGIHHCDPCYTGQAVNIVMTNKKRREINTAIMLKHEGDVRVRTSQERFAELSTEKKYNFNKGTERRHTEHFDQDVLKYILDNKSEFAHFQHNSSQGSADVFQAGQKYLDQSYKGRIDTTWFKSKKTKEGRWYAKGSMSLINICRGMRHSIAASHYVDLDYVNCHPVCLLGMCKEWDLKTPKLVEYLTNREPVLRQVADDCGVDREVAKRNVLAIINGGSNKYNGKSEWMKQWSAEMKMVRTKAMEAHPELYENIKAQCIKDGKNYNYDGSLISHLMGLRENDALEAAVAVMFEEKYARPDDIVLCYDGFMIPKTDIEDARFLRAMKRAQAAGCKAANADLILKVKPMQRDSKIPASVPKYDEKMNTDNECDEFPVMYEGMPVMLIDTIDKSTGLTNGSRYTVTWDGDDTIDVRRDDDGEQFALEADVFYKSMVPAYATTVHKAQGMTITKPVMIWETDAMKRHEDGRHYMYTALTRATCANNIYIMVE